MEDVIDKYYKLWIIIGSDRRPETKQGIEGKIDRFRSGRVRVRDCLLYTSDAADE